MLVVGRCSWLRLVSWFSPFVFWFVAVFCGVVKWVGLDVGMLRLL